MGPHTKTLSKSCFHHIRSFRQIRSSMDHSTAVSVALALVSSRLDYVNSILSGSPLKHIARLQRAQHALARVVLQERSRARSAPLMQQLHWLPIDWRIRFKLTTLTYKALQTGRPSYLADLIQFQKTPKSTRSSSSQLGLLFIPRHNLSFGSRAFHVAAPKVWNTLPRTSHQAITITLLFQTSSEDTLLPLSLSILPPSVHLPTRPDSVHSDFGALQIVYLLTYLLTYKLLPRPKSWLSSYAYKILWRI